MHGPTPQLPNAARLIHCGNYQKIEFRKGKGSERLFVTAIFHDWANEFFRQSVRMLNGNVCGPYWMHG